MKYLKIILSLLILGSLCVSCESKITENSSSEQLALIPADAFFVVDIKGGIMQEKSGLNKPEDYKFMAFFKMAGGEIYPFVESLMKGTSDAGASLEQIVMYTTKSKTFGLSAKMLDKSAFEKWIEKLNLIPAGIKKSGSTSYLQFDEKVFLVWNDEYLILSANDGALGEDNLKDLLKPRADGLLAVNEDFQRFTKRSGDIRFWITYGDALNFMNELSDIKQPFIGGIFADYQKINMHASIEFNDGRIDGSMELSPVAEVEKLAEKYPTMKKDGFNRSILKDVPEMEYLAISLALNISEYYKFLKETFYGILKGSGMIPDKDKGGEIKGFLESPEIGEIVENLVGDIFVGIHGFNQGAIPYPLANLVFTIKNEDAFKSIVKKIPSEIINSKNPKYYSIDNSICPVYFAYKNNRVLVTNDIQSIESFTGNNPPAKTFADNAVNTLFSKSAVFYINLDLDSYPQFVKTLLANALGYGYGKFVSFINIYESFYTTGNDYYGAEGSLVLKNKNVNVLKQILKNLDDNLASLLK